MNESGATAFEVRDMAKRMEQDGARISTGRENDTGFVTYAPVSRMERAILVEALLPLAEKKEAERLVNG